MGGIAYERFRKALALAPTDPYVLATAGNGVAAFDDADAEPALRAAALSAPDVPLTRLMYGAYLSREGLHEDALRELLAARDLNEDDSQIAYELGVAYALAEDYDYWACWMEAFCGLAAERGWLAPAALAALEAELAGRPPGHDH